MRKRAVALAAGLLLLWHPGGRAEAPASDAVRDPRSSLFAQSAAGVLSREFSRADVSFLLLDARTGVVLASHWENVDGPIPLGSLVKPFLAIAYGEQHAFRYPAHNCLGSASGCWLSRGHGEMDITSAIAYSCNSYFRMLAAGVTAADVSRTAARFGLQPPAPESSGPAFIGLGRSWRISPLSMARAYLELMQRRDQPGVRAVLAGMEQSAWQGTGAEVDRALAYPDALVKTGTAACTHGHPAGGDGFVITVEPADHPQVLLMVRVHGVPGRQAARMAGQMMRRIQE